MFPVSSCCFRIIRAEAPCWKGEVQLGRFVLGWQRLPSKGPSDEQKSHTEAVKAYRTGDLEMLPGAVIA